MPVYVPEPTPQGDDASELARYLQQELFRLAQAVNFKTDGAGGGLTEVGPPVATTFPVIPVPLTAFTVGVPDDNKLFGVVPDLVDGSLTVITGGAYVFQFSCGVLAIPNNTVITFKLAINGVLIDVGYLVEYGNFIDQAAVVFSSMINIVRGDKLQIFISAEAERIADVASASFITFRISESTD